MSDNLGIRFEIHEISLGIDKVVIDLQEKYIKYSQVFIENPLKICCKTIEKLAKIHVKSFEKSLEISEIHSENLEKSVKHLLKASGNPFYRMSDRKSVQNPQDFLENPHNFHCVL